MSAGVATPRGHRRVYRRDEGYSIFRRRRRAQARTIAAIEVLPLI